LADRRLSLTDTQVHCDAFDEIHIDGVAWMFHTLERRLNRVFRACGRKGKVEIDTEYYDSE
jgi:hypothetical protein